MTGWLDRLEVSAAVVDVRARIDRLGKVWALVGIGGNRCDFCGLANKRAKKSKKEQWLAWRTKAHKGAQKQR